MDIKIIVVSILFAFILVSGAVFVFILPRRSSTPGINIIKALFVANSIYDLGYAFELISTSIQDKLFFNHFQYFGTVFIAVLWYMLSVQFKNRNFKWTAKRLYPFLIIPLTTLIMNLTYIQNGLLYSSYRLIDWNGMNLVIFQKGIWYYINAVFQNMLEFLAIISYCKVVKKAHGIEKKQSVLLLILSITGFIGTMSFFFYSGTSNIDYGTIDISVFSVLFLITLFKYELFELLPNAYYNVFEAADYPIMILSDSLDLVKANCVAQNFFGDMIQGRYYVSLDRIFDAYPEFTNTLLRKGRYSFKKTIRDEELYFIAKLSRLHYKKSRHNEDLGYLLMFTNETSHIKRIQNLEIESSVDPLTGSYNRRYFYKIAEYIAEKAKIEGAPLSIIMIDIDNFKHINDIYGHQAGDYVLKSLTSIVKKQLRENDIFSRFGGEEFIVLLPSTKPDSAFAIASRICASVRESIIDYNGETIRLTISGGVTGTELMTLGIDDYIGIADKALYKAKENGRDKVFLLLESDNRANIKAGHIMN